MPALIVFLVAALYASVGHGGASGYLAALSFFPIDHKQLSSTALILNVLVAGTACFTFARAGYLSWKLTLPFIAASIPAALLGGLLPVSEKTYQLLLAAVLIAAAFRLGSPVHDTADDTQVTPPRLSISLPVGGAIGLLSGVVGVGGGIFLSPIILIFNWANNRYTAATSALFIVVNSLAGIIGRVVGNNLVLGDMIPLAVSAFLGGLVGSYAGAKRLSGPALRRLLAAVLVIAAAKLVLSVKW